MLAVGAGGLAVNAVKGIFGGGGDSSPAESGKQDQKRSTGGDDQISKALASLSKSGMLAFFHFFFSFLVYVFLVFGLCQNSNTSMNRNTFVEPANLHRGKDWLRLSIHSLITLLLSLEIDARHLAQSYRLGAMPDCCRDQCYWSH